MECVLLISVNFHTTNKKEPFVKMMENAPAMNVTLCTICKKESCVKMMTNAQMMDANLSTTNKRKKQLNNESIFYS